MDSPVFLSKNFISSISTAKVAAASLVLPAFGRQMFQHRARTRRAAPGRAGLRRPVIAAAGGSPWPRRSRPAAPGRRLADCRRADASEHERDQHAGHAVGVLGAAGQVADRGPGGAAEDRLPVVRRLCRASTVSGWLPAAPWTLSAPRSARCRPLGRPVRRAAETPASRTACGAQSKSTRPN